MTRTISAVPSARKRFMSVMRMWLSAAWQSGACAALCTSKAFRHSNFASITLHTVAVRRMRTRLRSPLSAWFQEARMPRQSTRAAARLTSPLTSRSHQVDASAANIGQNLAHENRMVSWQISIPRSWSRSSTSLSDNGNRMNSLTARRVTSSQVLT